MDNKWEMLDSSSEEREKIWTKNRTFAGDVWFRFRRKPTAIAGFVMIILLLLFALAGPLFTDYSYSVQDLEVVNIPPVMRVYDTPDGDGYLYITQGLKVLYVNPDGTLGEQLNKVREESDMSMTIFDYKGTEVGLYYGQKPYVMADPATKVIYPDSMMRNASYLLGTDSLGRDILTRLMYGVRVSLLVAFVAAAVNMVIGILYGGISGYLGGNVDTVMMRVVDIINTIPSDPVRDTDYGAVGLRSSEHHRRSGERLLGGYGPSSKRPGAQLKAAGICSGGKDHRFLHQRQFCSSI